MSEYNIQMNKYNALNAEYDQLYPQPMKHASTHAKDGDDPITPSSIGAAELGADGKVLTSQLPSMEVDAYTKVQTLSDTTKTLFGLDATAVPDDVLSLIKTLIDNANSNVNSKARIQIVSYVGTGTNGSSNPNSLTFDFQPKIVMGVCRDESGYINPFNSDSLANFNYDILYVDLMTTEYQKGLGFGKINNEVSDKYPYGKRSSDGKTIYWYHNSGPHYQANVSGNTYYYLAIG